MKKLFKDIRHNDIEAIKVSIAKNPAIVNEYFNGKAPKKDVGQPPLQVTIKCGYFEIIQLLLKHGADVNFIETQKSFPFTVPVCQCFTMQSLGLWIRCYITTVKVLNNMFSW